MYNGAGFEPWIDTVLTAVDTSSLVVVDTSKNVGTLMSNEVSEMYDAAVEVLDAGVNATVSASANASSAPILDASGYLDVEFAQTSGDYGGYLKVVSNDGGDLRFFVTSSTEFTISSADGTEIEYEMENGAVSSYPMFNGLQVRRARGRPGVHRSLHLGHLRRYPA